MPSIINLSKTSKHINRANQFKNAYNIGLDAKLHVGLLSRLHVAHKIILKLKKKNYNHCQALDQMHVKLAHLPTTQIIRTCPSQM